VGVAVSKTVTSARVTARLEPVITVRK
jgi:hypothetical protein